MRENAETKGRRYVTEGRLRLERISLGEIEATCRGAGQTYTLGFRRGGWFCRCPAIGRCAHLVAIQLVTDRPGGVER